MGPCEQTRFHGYGAISRAILKNPRSTELFLSLASPRNLTWGEVSREYFPSLPEEQFEVSDKLTSTRLVQDPLVCLFPCTVHSRGFFQTLPSFLKGCELVDGLF